ncbi:MAG: dihydroorotate dehydrogenase [Cyanobacteria bacterium]|nr:dihydroorotate dehydrogenase [Cyanobacteriota bacterium]
MSETPCLEIKLPHINFNFQNPILNASGTFYPASFDQLCPLAKCMGGIVTKTVTPTAKTGNSQPRTVELPGIGMLNSIGLQNPGLAYTLEKDLESLSTYHLPIILSIAATSLQEFSQMSEQIVSVQSQYPNLLALEINLSCPNVDKGGLDFGSSCDGITEVVKTVRDIWPGVLWAKLTPNAGNIIPLAGAAVEAGASGITAINTLLGVAIDIRRRRPILPRVSGGYSGPGVKPVALHAVWQLYKHFPEIPIIGIGGIQSLDDTLEFMMAGASLIQVGTACFARPTLFEDIHNGLTQFARQEGLAHLQELVGCAHSQ